MNLGGKIADTSQARMEVRKTYAAARKASKA